MPKSKSFDLEEFRIQRKNDLIRGYWSPTVEDIKLAYVAGERDFSRINLQNINLSNCIMPDMNLESALIVNCDFAYTNLRNSNLMYAQFVRSNLNGTVMNGSNLIGSTFSITTLVGAKLCNVQAGGSCWHDSVLVSADLDESDFNCADMIRVDLDGAYCCKVNFTGAQLAGAKLYSANLELAILEDACLDNAMLCGSKIGKANLLGASGLYSIFGFTLSSRQDSLQGGIVIENNKIQLRFWAGYQICVTEAYLVDREERKHQGNRYGKQYIEAIKMIKRMFKLDMVNHIWDYHLELYNPE